MSNKTFYRRNLPHIQPEGSTFFITTRLYGSIPKVKLDELKQQYSKILMGNNNIKDKRERNIQNYELRKQYFFSLEELLHKINSGPNYLSNLEIAEIVKNQIVRFHGEFYDLISYTIMSNHIHILIDTSIQTPQIIEPNQIHDPYVQVDKIMKRIKGASARYSNALLNLSGQFWERESFDIYIRNTKMLRNVINYILNNPVKAGIVKSWEDHPFTYLKNYKV